MVVLLGEQKLTLEERVTALEEEVSELEALQDMNNQLLEGSNEIEADLREELEIARAQTRQVSEDLLYSEYENFQVLWTGDIVRAVESFGGPRYKPKIRAPRWCYLTV